MAVFDRSPSSFLFSSAFHVKAQGFLLPICERKSSNSRGSARLKSGFGSRDPFCCNLVSMGRNSKEMIALAHSYSHEGFEFDRRSRKKNIGVVNAQQQQEEDDYKGEDDEHSSEALKATLEQSKRVLAMQKQLIEQIAERRKFVSSLKEKMGSSSSQGIDDEDTTLQQNNQNEKLREIVEKYEETNDKDKGFTDKQVGFEEDYPKGSKAVSEDRSNDAHRKTRFLERSPSSDFSKEASASQSKSSLQTVVKTDFSTPKNEVVNEVHRNLDEQRYAESFAKQEDISHSQEGESRPPPLAGTNVMNIVVVAAECAPWSKTGGLGDVAGSLPKALARRGHRVMVVAPRYGDYHEGQDVGVCQRYSVNGQDFEVRYQQAYIDNVDFVFINCAIFRGLQKNIYQGNREDVLRRMVLLCKAAVEVPWHVPCGGICYGDGNLVFIANDWHTALLPVYLQAYYRDNGLMKFTRSVLVIHNLAHQGRGPVADFKFLDLPDRYLDLFKLYDPVGGEHMNVFMAGIKAAHRIVAVSHGYAWECQTVEGGWGLHEIMKESSWKLRGIVNGIDENDWNPEVDVYLKDNGYCNYSLETLEARKPACKAALQRELGLPVRPDVALIGFIGRLDHQKGVDLIAEAIPWMVQQDLQLIMLGTGRADLEGMLRSFEGNYHDKVRGWVGFCVKTAHRITAGCDILLMPSRFEPCGLNQLYAMRYGTVPVVHAVGGLRDTVQPFDPFQETGLGWTFDGAEPSRLIHSLGNAMWTYRDYKESWKGIQRRGMSQDLSWDNAAKQYEEVLLAAKYQW